MNEAVVADLTSIIVVAADSGPLLGTCIDSALGSNVPVEVILVDNASRDGEVERTLAAHVQDRRLRVLRNGDNLGFGPACNLGAAHARGDTLVFLNPDCELQAHTIADLRTALGSDVRLGVLGVTILASDGRPARGNRRRDPTLRRALASLTGLARLESRWPALAGVEMPPVAALTALESVDAVSGACMVLSRTGFARIGGFDEGFFLHCEDLDLCRRARDAGLRVAIAPTIRVTHAQGSSSRCRPLFVARHKHRGLWRYFTKFDPAARNLPLRALVWLGIWTHFALTAPLLLARRRQD